MQTTALSTAEVLALRALGRNVDARWVEWAVSMLAAGRDTPSLRVLAGESAPFHFFEMGALVDRTLAELGLRQHKSRSEAATSYAAALARRILDGSAAMDVALREISDVCWREGYPKELYDFYLLCDAYEGLRADGVQFSWPGADRENVDEVVRGYCRRWLAAHPSIV